MESEVSKSDADDRADALGQVAQSPRRVQEIFWALRHHESLFQFFPEGFIGADRAVAQLALSVEEVLAQKESA